MPTLPSDEFNFLRLRVDGEAERTDSSNALLWLVRNGLTREDLQKNIERQPARWKRYERFLDALPSLATSSVVVNTEAPPCSANAVTTGLSVFVIAKSSSGMQTLLRYAVGVAATDLADRSHCDAAVALASRDGYADGHAFDERDDAGKLMLDLFRAQDLVREIARTPKFNEPGGFSVWALTKNTRDVLGPLVDQARTLVDDRPWAEYAEYVQDLGTAGEHELADFGSMSSDTEYGTDFCERFSSGG